MPRKISLTGVVDRSKRTSRINTWKPKDDSQIFVEQDNKLFICHFDRIFDSPNLEAYNRFIIAKTSYENQLDKIISYTNFFINNYDSDKELVTAYLKLKFVIDKVKTFDKNSVKGFIDLVYEVMFTPSMVKKIRKLVEDNYLDDIESVDDDMSKRKYLKSEKKHLESLEFTNQHIKVLLGISFGMKVMSPVLFHFARLNDVDISKESDVIYQFYKGLFTIFGYGDNYDVYDINDVSLYQHNVAADQVKAHIEAEGLVPVDHGYTVRYYFTYHDDTTGEDHEAYYTPIRVQMYNKLFVYVKAKVLESNASNMPIFSQREIFGIDTYTVIHQFTQRVIISENMVKYKFNEHWNPKTGQYTESIIGLTNVVKTY